MKLMVSLALASTIVISGCATTFQEPPPDFTKKNAEARAEIDRFHVDFMNENVTTIKRKSYYTDSLRPIIRDVSPDAEKTLTNAATWRSLGWAFIGVAILTLSQPRDTWVRQTGYWVSLGLSIGSSSYATHLGNRAGREFNRDFEGKFTP